MERASFKAKLRPDKRDEYIEAHRHVWPELIDAAQGAGLRNHSVFLAGDTLFFYAESENLARSLQQYLATDVKKRWDDRMSGFLDGEPEQLEEVFHFD